MIFLFQYKQQLPFFPCSWVANKTVTYMPFRRRFSGDEAFLTDPNAYNDRLNMTRAAATEVTGVEVDGNGKVSRL